MELECQTPRTLEEAFRLGRTGTIYQVLLTDISDDDICIGSIMEMDPPSTSTQKPNPAMNTNANAGQIQHPSKEKNATGPIIPIPSPPAAVKSPFKALRVEILTKSAATSGTDPSCRSDVFVTMSPNSSEPIPFETDLFVGAATIIIRTEPTNHPAIFDGNKKEFELQVQGKFKRYPIGELYAGAESTKKMELGMITRGISKAAMSFLSTMVSDLHYSFGDPLSQTNSQLPHATAPLFTAAPRLLATKPGDPLPLLGQPLEEDAESKKKRQKFRCLEDIGIDISNTYTISVYCPTIDFPNWNMVNVPYVKPMDLRNVFADGAIRLVAYELPKVFAAANKDLHTSKALNYIFCMKFTPVDPSLADDIDLNSPILVSPQEPISSAISVSSSVQSSVMSTGSNQENHIQLATSSARRQSSVGTGATSLTTSSNTSLTMTTVSIDVDGDTVADSYGYPYISEDDEDLEGDPNARGEDIVKSQSSATTGHAISSTSSITTSAGAAPGQENRPNDVKNKIKNWIRKHMPDKTLDIIGDNIPESDGPYSCLDFDLEAGGDLRFCPASVRLLGDAAKSKSGVFYVLIFVHPTTGVQQFRLRSYGEVHQAFSLTQVNIPKLHKNRKLSNDEKKRRHIVEGYRQLLHSQLTNNNANSNSNTGQQTISSFLGSAQTKIEKNFLGGGSGLSRSLLSSKIEGHVAWCRSSRVWEERVLKLDSAGGGEVKLLKGSSELPFNNTSFPISSVLAVRRMGSGSTESPVANHNPGPIPFEVAYFQIETCVKIYYFMVRSEAILNEWLSAFNQVLGSAILPAAAPLASLPISSGGTTVAGTSDGSGISSNINSSNADGGKGDSSIDVDISDYSRLAIAKPIDWKLDKRLVLNHRQIFFHGKFVAKARSLNFNELSESILRQAFALTEMNDSSNNGSIPMSLWVQFFDDVSCLQVIDVYSLTTREKLAGFLNVYHAMILHGWLILGIPAWKNWLHFFNTVTYIIGFDIMTISDIENCILRAGMSKSPATNYPNVRSLGPPSQYPGIALNHRDFRLNFCANNGSISMASMVPIYTREALDRQLDEMTTLMLCEKLEVDQKRRVVILPIAAKQIVNTAGQIQQHLSGALASTSSSSPVTTPSATPLDCLRAVASYVAGGDRRAVVRLLSEGSAPIIKFKNFAYSVRKFKLYRENFMNQNKNFAGPGDSDAADESEAEMKFSLDDNDALRLE